MQNYRFGEVVLFAFPFASRQEVKRRPAPELLDTGNADILVARITSQDVDMDYDVRLADWAQAGLLLPLVTRLHKLATLQKSLVERQLGALT
jgi:mRNA interferase MazF